jgi:NtrC-family two-component system response regulator AlgB
MDILIVDDDKSIRTSTSMAIEEEGHYVETADQIKTAQLRLKEENFDLVLIDLRLGEEDGMELLRFVLGKNPAQLAVIFTAHASIESAIKATREGAFDYLSKPFTPDQLRAVLVKAERALKTQGEIRNLKTTVSELRSEVDRSSPPPRFDSNDVMMRSALGTLFRAASTPASILILGESGTGKSVIAKSIHEQSHVSDQPFVTISCPSLSRELLESELFGHVKGAFTGAVKDKWGKVHAADGGTLFLDEIGELPPAIQPKLLRLLQEREYERLGENKVRRSNVRIIAATNRDLKKSVADGEFREDLYYRINVIPVELPPLRARREDLMNFADDYLKHFGGQIGRRVESFSTGAREFMENYPWPGNLRELRNAIERAAILCRGKQIERSDFPPMDAMLPVNGTDKERVAPGSEISLAELEEEHIRLVVDRTKNLQEAARILGIDKATLYRKRKKMQMA